ncbi:MAG: thymidine phosphorylase, partial [Gemmataceae bacterium]|nr:thymidine phosphorylase [Gemmataceae bacterium]
MAIVLRGMDAGETATLTGAMLHSGSVLDWGGAAPRAVDKHSTGGVGDKTSLVLAPLAAACGALVPMMSGRGLGHTGGTLDKLEAIPGFRVGVSLEEARSILSRVGCVMMSQTAEVAPADRVLYALRDVTATVESLPLISASIMSKKLAEGVRGLVLDVKQGDGAFMKTLPAARELAQAMRAIGAAHGVRTQALLTSMEHPLGRACGNALEVAECVAVLEGGGPDDVKALSVELAARMVDLAGLGDGRAKVEEALASGRGLEVFERMVREQGGDLSKMQVCEEAHVLRADRAGYFQGWKAEAVGRAIVALGGGRARAEDGVDPGVGAFVLARPGEQVKAGDGLLEIRWRSKGREEALRLLAGAGAIGDSPPTVLPLIAEVLDA